MDETAHLETALEVIVHRSLEQGQSPPPREDSILRHFAWLGYSAPIIFGDSVRGFPSSWKGGLHGELTNA